MKIAGVREALEASKTTLIQLIINPLIRRPQYWWHHFAKGLQISDLDLQAFSSFLALAVVLPLLVKKTTQKCFKLFHCVSFGFALFAQKFAH